MPEAFREEVEILPELNPEVTRVVQNAFKLVGDLTGGRRSKVVLFSRRGELGEERGWATVVAKIGEEEVSEEIALGNEKLIKQLLGLVWGVDWNNPFRKSEPSSRSQVGRSRYYRTNDPHIIVVEEKRQKSVWGEGQNYFHNTILMRRLSLREKVSSAF